MNKLRAPKSLAQPDADRVIESVNLASIEGQIESLRAVSGDYCHALELVGALTRGLRVTNFFSQLGRVFRGRVGKFDCVNDLWYPPPESVRAFGRLNRPGAPVFYACVNLLAVFAELCRGNEKYVTIITFEPEDSNQRFRFGHIGFYSTTIDEESGASIRTQLRQHLVEVEAGLPSDLDRAKHRRITDFLNEEFRKEVAPGNEHEYVLSSAIADFFFGMRKLPIDKGVFLGLVYPSIATGGQTENIAIEPDAVDRFLVPAQADLYAISWRENHIVEEHISQGTMRSDGHIVW